VKSEGKPVFSKKLCITNRRTQCKRCYCSNPKRQTKFTEALDKIRDMKLTFFCNAVGNEEVA
jgi:hypothetical protein